MSKRCKLFASFICLLLALVCFTGCSQLTETPEQIAKKAAEEAAQEVFSKIIFGEADRTAITSNVTFVTENKNYPGVKIEWSSSEEDVIDATGKVTRPSYNDERAVMVGEDKVVKVVITATVSATYSWGPEGSANELTTEPISKQFNFSVLTMADGIDSGTIKDVKARAWNYIYVEQGVEKALVSNSSVVYNVQLKGKVTGKLQSDGSTKGFFMHDGTEGIYVFGDNSANVGDYVEVIGEIYSYYGNLQVGSNITVNVIDDQGYELPEPIHYTPQSWEDKTSGLGDEVIGRIGGDLVKVSGYLTAKAAPAGSGKYCLVDAETGEESWIYYKSYTAEMEETLKANVGEYVNLYGVSYDRDSRIMKNEILWTGELEVAEAPKVDDAAKVQVELAQITLNASYTEDFDLSAAGVWEIVSGTGIEIVEGVAKVTRTNANQEVVLKVTVTIGEASGSKEFTVTIPSSEIEITDLAKANEIGLAQGHNVYTADKYYVEGVITEIVNETYGNMYITDGVNTFYVYGVYVNGAKYGEATDPKPVVGQKVLLNGVLGAYKEVAQMKNADLVAFEYGTEFETLNNKEAEALGAANAAGTADKYYVKGYVTEVANDKYGNIYIKDLYGNVLYVYGCYSFDGANRYDAMENAPKVGDFVVMYGILSAYNGVGQMKNGWLVQLNDVVFGGQTPEPGVHEHVACPTCGLCTAKDCDGAEEVKCPGHEVVTPTEGLKEGQAYRFTLVQPKAGKTVYFTGAMSSYYYATSEDINAGVDVFVEYVEGGLNLYFVDANDAKQYMGMVVSGTHINAVFDQDKTVFTYNEELKTVVGLVDGKEYVFGTRNDNTYLTIGANALSYNPFMVTFVPVGGETPHEHNFVEGKCECGAVDPNYTPTHVHEACPECGKCLAEDCDGEKCEGHEVEPEVTEKVELTDAKLGLGAYADGSKNVDGVDFSFVELGSYGNGIQWRNKTKASSLWNTTAFAKPIAKIELVYNAAKATYTNANALKIEFGADSSVSSYSTLLSTTSGTTLYTITPDAETYTFVKFTINITYSMYFDSITIYFADGDVVTPHEHNFVEGKCECGEVDPNYVPPHVHEACPECGKCLAEDCDGEKCEGHEVEPEVTEKVELTDAKLGLGAYADGSKNVDGVDFSFVELGSYGNGIQWRNKTKASSLWNTTAFAKPIAKIELVYNAAKATYTNANALKIEFGADSSVSSYSTLLSTTSGTTLYTITPDAETYTFVKFTINITYSMYFDSITIYFADGDVVTPHEHVGGKATCNALAVCDVCGESYGEFAEHVWDERGYSYDNEKHWVDCVVCQAAKNNEAAHDFSNGNCICGKEAPGVHEHVGGQATCTELAVCSVCGESYGELAAHVDTNLDITCDFEGCTKRILPAADSKVSLFTANHMIIVSLSSNYYVEGVITEITDAKNGVFIIADEAGDSILVRLPKNAEGVSYASWTDLKVVVGDTVQLYGKPARNSSSPTTEKAKIEGGVLTVLKHEHKFSEATCTEPSICACLTINEQPLGHADENADKICDRCQFDLTLKVENIVVATDTTLSNGVIDEAKTFWTWAGTDFDVVIAKGTSTFTLYTTAKAYMQLKKQNTISVLNKTNAIIQTITVYVTNATQLTNLKAAFAGLNFVENTEKLNLVITWNSSEDFVTSNVGTTTVYVSGVEVLYKPASEEPAPHVHNFVEGKCECGEEDPNYIPPHVHVACETCGLCVAEDCDGAEEVKCAGHEAQSAVTVTFVVADVASAQGWGSSSNCLKEAYAIDENISISVAGGSNSGKCYTDHLRIYATDTPAGSITLTAAEGYKIQSVSFGLVTGTYAFLQFDGATVENGQVVEIDAASAVFNTVKNGSSGKQVRLLSVTITYVAA